MSKENGLGNEIIEALMDDFYAESDEHLEAVRNGLLRVERRTADAALEPSLVEDLFRRFHTLKGLSGMVGLDGAEVVAHTIESFLRKLRGRKESMLEADMDDLVDGVKLIEQIITARKTGSPMPNIAPWEQRMGRRASLSVPPKQPKTAESPEAPPPDEEKTAPFPEEVQREMEKAVSEGAVLHVFEFSPSKALADRGINVNLIRERFQEIGRLIHAAPRVREEGGVSFEFVVAATADESAFEAWKEDGLAWRPYSLGAPEAGPTLSEMPGSQAPAPGMSVSPSTVVRVDIGRVDDLMRLVGELVISRARMEDAIRLVSPDLGKTRARTLHETDQRMERQLRDLREGVMRLRMVPIAEIFNRMQFVVRDLSRETRKEIRLTLEGQDTELDKFVVERMMDPLLHLVRNAVSHGLESQEDRVKKGKPPAGNLALKAATSGDQVMIQVGDDGRGLDHDAIRKRAQAQGLVSQGEALTEEGLLNVLCAPGFSTKDDADRASGRGVGMAVVHETVRELGGTLSVASKPEAGTLFTITLPLTLAITDAFIILAGGQRFAVPQGLVREVIEFAPEDLVSTQETELLLYRDSALPLVRLARVFALPEGSPGKLYGLIMGLGRTSVGVVIDRVLARREVVVRPVTDPLLQVPGISGATELGDGKAVLILDGTVGGMGMKK